MLRTRFVLSVVLILAVNSLGQSAFAQGTWVNSKTGQTVPSMPGLPGTQLDPTDPNRAFNPTTGNNYYRDKNGSWKNAKTGQTVPSMPGLPGTQLDPADPNRAFNPTTGNNYHWEPSETPKTKPSVGLRVPVEQSAPLAQIPQGLGSFGLAARYDGEFLHSMKITNHSASLNGIVSSGNLSNASKTSFKYNAGTVDIPIGLPTFHLFGDSSLYIAPVFTVGAAVYDLKFRDRQSGATTTYTGSGPMIGGGFGSTIMNAHCPYFGGLDILYRDNLGVGGIRPSPTSSNNGSQTNTLSYYEWNVAARGGYSFATGFPFAPSVSPWAGVEFDSTNVKLIGSESFTSLLGQALSVGIKNEVTANDFKGIAGLDARFCGQLFGRAQVSFNDTDYAVMAKLVYQFDLSDLWK